MDEAELLARHLVSIAVEFSAARRPLSLGHLHRAFYGQYSRASFYTLFRRDRESLETCGLRLREVEGGWEADPDSFAANPEVDPLDLVALDLACLPLAHDDGFPYRYELRHALSKVDRCFADSPVATTPEADGRAGRTLELLRARSRRHLAKVRYVNADSVASTRTLAVYGVFGLRGHTYFVAADVDDEGHAAAPRTFRDDRLRRVSELDGTSYEIPDDFHLEDWRRLPFQVGDGCFEAVLDPPERLSDEANQALRTHGQVGPQGDGWHVQAADLQLLARWAVAEGFTPVSPPELIDAWRSILEEVGS